MKNILNLSLVYYRIKYNLPSMIFNFHKAIKFFIMFAVGLSLIATANPYQSKIDHNHHTHETLSDEHHHHEDDLVIYLDNIEDRGTSSPITNHIHLNGFEQSPTFLITSPLKITVPFEKFAFSIDHGDIILDNASHRLERPPRAIL